LRPPSLIIVLIEVMPNVLAGKYVQTFDTGRRARTTVEDLRRVLRRFRTRDALQQFGAAAGVMWSNHSAGVRVGRVPLPLHAIPYLALLSIECSDDSREDAMTVSDLAELASIFIDLEDPASADLATDPQAATEFVFRTATQFDFQRELRHQLPRVVMLLREIWPRVEKARAIVPTDDLVRLTGLDLDRLLLFGWAFAQSGANGFFRPYPEGNLRLFSLDAQATFLRWASADYATLRARGAEAKAKIPNDTFDQYRFNPLTVCPIVRPDIQPDPRNGDVYLLPCQRLLFERVHRGLYHLLADDHRGEGAGENPFRVAFGYVFQEYVGELLRAALGATRVHPEIRYSDPAGERDTVDWIVVEGDVGVLVEVKQSALSLPAKSFGDLSAARADLRKTLAKAVGQLGQTEVAIRARRRGLERFSQVRQFERLVVTYDSIHFANSFVRDLITEETGPQAPHAHISSIEELEYVLGRCPTESLHGLLRQKREDSNEAVLDFKDWLGYDDHRRGSKTLNPYLWKRYKEYIGSWGLPEGAIG
jgi:hypothetical protein